MDPSIFPRTRKWSEQVGVWDLRQYILNNVSLDDVVVVGAVFCPGFVERSGGVFIDFMFDDAAYARWVAETHGDIRAIEGILNHLHLWDVFDPKSELEYSAISELAPKIANAWKASACSAFPTREFSVVISDGADDYGPTITLYSE